jgi:hypothetical protein
MKKSYHSSDVPIRLATMTLRTDDGAVAGTRLTADICASLDRGVFSTPTRPEPTRGDGSKNLASATEAALALPV